MRNRRFLLIIAGIILFLLFVWLLFLRTEGVKEPSRPVSPTPTIFPASQTRSRTIISGVEVNDPTDKPLEKNGTGDVLFAQDAEYQLVYLPTFQEFNITVLASPFEQVRTRAEEAFLASLGISKEDACRLNVTLGTIFAINPNESGTTYDLSFCPE